MKRKTVGIHKVATAALFTVGNLLLRYPWRDTESNALLLFLLSVLGAWITTLLLYPLFRKLYRAPMGRSFGRRLGMGLLSLALGAYALFCVYRCCSDYLRMSLELILPGGSRLLIVGFFLLCALGIARLNCKGIDHFALFGLVATLFCAILLFSFGISHFQIDFFQPQWRSWELSALGSLPTIWLETALPLTLLILYEALVIPRGGRKALLTGTAVGGALLLLCVLQVILTFGAVYAAELPYPYAYSARILSVGQYFFRLEGLSYLLDFLSCVFRSAVCLALVGRLARRFFPRLGKNLIIGCATILFVIFCVG